MEGGAGFFLSAEELKSPAKPVVSLAVGRVDAQGATGVSRRLFPPLHLAQHERTVR